MQGLKTFSGGSMPTLSAAGANIPPALSDEARADGSLEPGKTAEYVFVPAGKSWNEALLVTDRAIVRRSPGGVRRYPAWDADLNFSFFRRQDDRGVVVSAGKRGRPDTLYLGLSGAEPGALSSAIAAAQAAHAPPK